MAAGVTTVEPNTHGGGSVGVTGVTVVNTTTATVHNYQPLGAHRYNRQVRVVLAAALAAGAPMTVVIQETVLRPPVVFDASGALQGAGFPCEVVATATLTRLKAVPETVVQGGRLGDGASGAVAVNTHWHFEFVATVAIPGGASIVLEWPDDWDLSGLAANASYAVRAVIAVHRARGRGRRARCPRRTAQGAAIRHVGRLDQGGLRRGRRRNRLSVH
jgi:hypothetical protein